ncbi:MAG: ShlB/FhaC/HecB family hemolysin secretion/activation protein [Magnetococcales bacterium]|nr:ShlB/FhaC/HecB family hemolysin secretion/activation protein [Magnetococcales bacterium]
MRKLKNKQKFQGALSASLLFLSSIAIAVPATVTAEDFSARKEREANFPKARAQFGKADIDLPEGGSGMMEQFKKVKLHFAGTKGEITGATQYSQDELQGYFSELTGNEITLDKVYEAANAIELRYKNDGFVLARVVIPAQTISDGRVKVMVYEGFIDKVTVNAPGNIRDVIKGFADKLTSYNPINIEQLERYLLLINDLPGVKAKSILRPGAKSGSTEIVVRTEQNRFAGTASVNNYGTEFVGPGLVSVSGTTNSLFDWGEQFTVELTGTLPKAEEYNSRRFAFSLPMGSEGFRMDLEYLSVDSDPGYTLSELLALSDTEKFAIQAYYPTIRSRMHNLSFTAGYDHRNASTEILNAPFQDDRVRSVHIGGVYDWADAMDGINLVALTVTQGIPSGSATKRGDTLSSRPESTPAFTRLNLEASRLQSLQSMVENLSFYTALAVQMADEPLYSSEEFSIGGREFGRGYNLGDIAGDRGLAVKAELQYTATLPKESSVQLYGFFDYGKIWNVDSVDRGTIRETDSLASSGAGLRFNLTKYVAIELEMAKPLTKTPTTFDEKDPRYFGQMKLSF